MVTEIEAQLRTYWVGRRVEVPAHLDVWMRGDRYGEVTWARCGLMDPSTNTPHVELTIRLDKSGRLPRVNADLVKVIP